MNKSDLVPLLDMYNYGLKIQDYTSGKTLEDFETDEIGLSAVMYWLVIFGEAANRVSESFQASHPEIPWAQVVAMRNILVHAYWRIRNDLVWSAITQTLPPLLVQLKSWVESAANATPDPDAQS
jgi:uncharacterized protein with HEPN domain